MTLLRRSLMVAAAGAALFLSRPLFGQSTTAPRGVTFFGPQAAIISSGVVIPPGRSVVWTSGTTPPLLRPDLAAGNKERFGDTRTQASGTLKAIEMQLASQGLTMKDVVYLRAYLVPDAGKDGKIDVAGWNAAYGEFFGTTINPIKPARSTVGVVALVNPEWLIELEAFAVMPR